MLARLQEMTPAADACVRAAAWAMSDADLRAALEAVRTLRARLDAVNAHLLTEIVGRGLPRADGATSPGVWLREHQRVAHHTGRDALALAGALDRVPDLDAAVGAGTVNAEQAVVIDAAITALPAEVDPEIRGQALAMLIGFAARFEPATLRRLGEQILTYVAPDVAERLEAEQLARQGERARTRRGLCLTDTGDGRTRLTGWLDTEAAAIITAALDPLCAPTGGDTRSPTQRRADALTDVCAMSLRGDELPASGGEAAHLVLTMPFAWLREQVGTATLDTGGRLTPEQARRLACDAAIVPAVLDGDGQVLDLGRTRRLVSAALRRALVLRDGGCAFPACDRPPRWCEAHHVTPWADGGDTCPSNMAILCGHHHRVVHHDGWRIHIAPDGRPEFTPPPHIDPQRRPLRNHHHLRNHQHRPHHGRGQRDHGGGDGASSGAAPCG